MEKSTRNILDKLEQYENQIDTIVKKEKMTQYYEGKLDLINQLRNFICN